MKVLRSGWWIAMLRRNACAGVLCALLLTLTVLTGRLAAQFFFSFWFDVSLYAFPPIWLYCFGCQLSTRWKWREWALGIGMAVLAFAFVDIGANDRLPMRFLWSGLLAAGGLGTATTGYLTARLVQVILADLRRLSHSRTAIFHSPHSNRPRQSSQRERLPAQAHRHHT